MLIANFHQGTFSKPPSSFQEEFFYLSCVKRDHITSDQAGLKHREAKVKMIRLHRLTPLLLAGAAILLLMAACGQNFSGSSNSASQPGQAGTPGTAQLVKTGIVPTKVPLHPSPTPTAPAQLTGKVMLQIDTLPQQASTPLVLTLSNQTSHAIMFSDHLSECTVLLLQVQPQSSASPGVWQTVAPCRLMIVTRLHSLAAGQTLTVTLAAPGKQWTAGLYQALLTYFSSSTNQKLQTVSSPTFQIG